MRRSLTDGQEIPRSGYSPDDDLADAGALAARIIRHLEAVQGPDVMRVRIIAASASVPSVRGVDDSQLAALRKI
jgi:hypothetical protein